MQTFGISVYCATAHPNSNLPYCLKDFLSLPPPPRPLPSFFSLLALGLKHFEGTEFPKPLISKYLLPTKTAHQLTVRIKNLNMNRAPDNIIRVSDTFRLWFGIFQICVSGWCLLYKKRCAVCSKDLFVYVLTLKRKFHPFISNEDFFKKTLSSVLCKYLYYYFDSFRAQHLQTVLVKLASVILTNSYK